MKPITRLITTVRLSGPDEKQIEEALRQAKIALAGSYAPVTAPDYEGKYTIRQPQHRLTPDELAVISNECGGTLHALDH